MQRRNSPQKRLGMTRFVKGFHSLTCMYTQAFMNEWNSHCCFYAALQIKALIHRTKAVLTYSSLQFYLEFECISVYCRQCKRLC